MSLTLSKVGAVSKICQVERLDCYQSAGSTVILPFIDTSRRSSLDFRDDALNYSFYFVLVMMSRNSRDVSLNKTGSTALVI